MKTMYLDQKGFWAILQHPASIRLSTMTAQCQDTVYWCLNPPDHSPEFMGGVMDSLRESMNFKGGVIKALQSAPPMLTADQINRMRMPGLWVIDWSKSRRIE